jgi:hypothetical protein
MKKILLLLLPALLSLNISKAQTALDFEYAEYVTISNPTNSLDFNGTSSFTLEAWINPGVISSQNYGALIEKSSGQIFDFSGMNPYFQTWGLVFNSNAILTFRAGNTTIASTTLLPDNQWSHVAATFDGVNLKLYYNGVLEASGIATGNTPLGGIVKISHPEEGLLGLKDDIRIWDVAKTQSDIQSNMNVCLTGVEPNLIAQFDFEDGIGSSTLTDKTGNGHNGSLVSMDANSDWVGGYGSCFTACLVDQTVSGDTSFLCSGSTDINVASSETGVLYYLRDNADNSIVSSPVAGTGTGISLNTGTISTTTTYNVHATNQTTALDLDGLDDYITLGDLNFISAGNASEYTVETWIKLDSYNPGYSWVFGDEITSNRGILFEISPTGYITAFHPGVGRQSSTNIQVPLGVWTHIALVQSSGSNGAVNSYVNGEFDDTLLGASNLNTETNSTTFIGIFPGGGRYLDGQIDDLRTWNIARSQSEIKANMLTCMSGTEVGLSNYYNFEDGTGSSVLNDLTSNNNNGTLTNMDAATDWVAGSSVCASCELEMTTTPTVTINPLNNTITQNTGVLTANQGSATYQWYECPNTLLSGETNQSFTPTVIGDYKVEITLSTCTVDSACENVAVLGSEDFENITKFSIYPNPTSGLLNINTSFDGQFIIVNQLGQIVHSFKATSNIENVINVENLANGIYFVKEINETLINSQKLIIKK